MIAFTLISHESIDSLIPLIREFYSHEAIRFSETEIRTVLSTLIDNSHYGKAWGILNSGHLVGYLIVTSGFSMEFAGACSVIDELFVLPEHRGKGIGGAALNHAFESARASGSTWILLEVDHQNLSAREIYRKVGFTPHRRFLMSKPLIRLEADNEVPAGQ